MPRSTLLWFGKPNTWLNIFVICCHVKWTSSRNKRFKSELVFFFSPSHGLRCVTHSHIDPQTSRVKVFQWLHSCDSLSRPWKHSLHDATLNTPNNRRWILNVPLALHHPLALRDVFPNKCSQWVGRQWCVISAHSTQRTEARMCVVQVQGWNKHTYIHTHTGSGMCACVTNNVCVLWVEGHAERSIVTTG